MKFNLAYYLKMSASWDVAELIKEVWKDGFDEGCKCSIFEAGDEVLAINEMCYGAVVSDNNDVAIRVLFEDGTIACYAPDEAHMFIEKTGTSYSEIPILREKLKYSNGREF